VLGLLANGVDPDASGLGFAPTKRKVKRSQNKAKFPNAEAHGSRKTGVLILEMELKKNGWATQQMSP